MSTTVRHRLTTAALSIFAPIGRRLCSKRALSVISHLPAVSFHVPTRASPPIGPWPDADLPPIPVELLSQPGIRRDLDGELQTYAAGPLTAFSTTYPRAVAFLYRHVWPALLQVAPSLIRSRRLCEEAPADPIRPRDGAELPGELTRALREHAARIGLSAVGFARYEARYATVGHDDQCGETVIVAVLEQNDAATQAAPSIRSNKAQFLAYAALGTRLVELAEFLHERGYCAKAHNTGVDHLVEIPFAVEAGLGQLGFNGQLLTPIAGSRVRLGIVVTDAPLVLDQPVDYGINGICDRCQICVQRCPARAIPGKRTLHRGIEKAKINTKRCFPVVATTNGCQICMKVCPVQRYGLKEVLEHYVVTGEIKGKGTNELEGFTWPLDGKRYGPGRRPVVTRRDLEPEGTEFSSAPEQPSRTDTIGTSAL
jgi:ferredoxin